ncbi:TolC family protein [Phyllobacterium sp. UNC302MFCol5.2]|uniref:TolC family protein n=1 Tax=Phyllobacterium sp. UNC302MFCol5.2 TaxID=1449065 RepID=UPI001FD9FC5F|nr:TolC family protein [Phyllobacterium sp. UNC302MFCol5.2]
MQLTTLIFLDRGFGAFMAQRCSEGVRTYQSICSQLCRFGMALKSLLLLSTALIIAGCTVVPKPLDELALSKIANSNLSRVVAAQEPVSGSIDVYEATARALKYNLDQRVELMQEAVNLQELNLATYQGLPNLVVNSGYTGRDNVLASSSTSVLTNQQSLEPSTSTDKNMLDSDITLSWNVLDFGLSYVRAQQAADKVMMQREARRKALNRIVEDVRTAYWRAIASEKLLSRLNSLEGKTRRAIADSRALAAERQTSPIVALTHERELLEIRRDAQQIEGELRIARSQLAALMNVPPNSHFRLSSERTRMGKPPVDVDPSRLIRVAIMNRPEVRDVAYRLRSNEKELDAALLEMLPGLDVFVGPSVSTNSFLYNDNWVGWGAQASWNLLKVFQYPQKKKLVASQAELLDQRSLALTMAIMTQVYVSRARYVHAQKELSTAGELKSVQHRLLDQIAASTTTEQTSEQTLIREEMNTVVSDVRYDLAYANLQNAYGNIYASIGLDAYPPVDIERASVSEIKDALRRTWVGRGDLTTVLAQADAAATQSALQSPPDATSKLTTGSVSTVKPYAAVMTAPETSVVQEVATPGRVIKVSTTSLRD